jgi:hypothetical protein
MGIDTPEVYGDEKSVALAARLLAKCDICNKALLRKGQHSDEAT